MDRKILKAASAVVAVSVVASSTALMTGCNRVSAEEDGVISAGSTWYDCKKIHLEIPFEKDDVEMVSVYSPVVCGDYIYAIVNAHRNMEKVKAEKGNNISYSDFNINEVAKYDMDGNYIESVKLENAAGYAFIQIANLNVQNGKVKASGLGSENDSYPYYLIDTDTDTAEFHDFHCDVSETSYINEFLDVGDYTCFVIEDEASNGGNYKIAIVQNDKTVNTVDLNKSISKPFEYISKFLAKDEDTLVITCVGKDHFTAELKVSTGEVTIVDNNLNTSGYRFMASQNGSCYAIDYSGVYAIDDELEPEPILDFANANVNISSLYGGEVFYADDDRILAYTFDASDPEWFDAYAYVFDKADKNPNAGKQILDVYSLSGELSYAEAEAIVKFNETSKDFYAKVSFADILDSEEEGDELINSLSESLMIDLINGDGPDVLLNAQGLDQFNNSDYFVDMTKFVDGPDGIDATKYFGNILDASKTQDGALYQMPVSFGVSGIMCLESAVNQGAKGFTYDEFIDFVGEECYGKNPLAASQSDFIVTSLRNDTIPYLKDGSINFDTDEFKMAAKYARENIFEELKTEEEDETENLLETKPNRLPNQPMEVNVNTNEYYVFSTLEFDKKASIYGYPSLDAKGPTATIISSVAISSAIDETAQNASWDFVRTLLSEEIQIEETNGMPVNRAAFETLTKEACDDITQGYYRLKKLDYTEDLIRIIGYGIVDESVCDDLVGLVENIDSISSLDSALVPILREELGAYFAGQKPIEDVISIINNRAQTVINERGGN